MVKANLSQYEGVYRPLTPRLEITRLISDIFALQTIKAEGEALVVKSGRFNKPYRFYPVGNGKFIKDGESEPSLIFFTGPTGATEVSSGIFVNNRKVGLFEAWWPIAMCIAFLAATALAVLSFFVWGIGRLLRRFKATRRWRVWAAAMLALAAAGSAVVGVLLGADNSLVLLSGPTAFTRAFQWGTMAMPLFALVGVASALFARDVATWTRVHAGLTSAIILAFSTYLYSYGRIGLTLWAYQPAIAAN